jgi:hypothetical protein
MIAQFEMRAPAKGLVYLGLASRLELAVNYTVLPAVFIIQYFDLNKFYFWNHQSLLTCYYLLLNTIFYQYIVLHYFNLII